MPPTPLPLLPLLALLLALTHPAHSAPPASFALLTVTHARAGDNSQFLTYIGRYATMQCPLITEINVVWNNQQTPSQMGVLADKPKWVRPVYFYQTPNNSMNWRYKIPKESQAEVFFSIDDDIIVDCAELTKGFAVWQSLAVDSIGPIVSYGPRLFEFTARQGFRYSTGKSPIFSLGLAGIAFISRHFLELYYSDIFELVEMRNHIVARNNCDDIGLNWLVNYYYPELPTHAIAGNLQNISPKVAQATSPTHYRYRTECLQKFTEIFGMNSLRLMPIDDKYPNHPTRGIPLRQATVRAKHEYFKTYIIGRNRDQIAATFTTSPNTTIKVENAAPIGVQAKPDNSGQQLLKRKIEQLEKQLELAKKQASADNDSFNELIELRKSLRLRSYFDLGLVVVCLFLSWLLLERWKNSASLKVSSEDSEERA